MCQYCSIQHLSSIALFHPFFFLSLSASFISEFISSRLVSLASLPNMTSFFSYIISHCLLPLPSELTHAHMQSRARTQTHAHTFLFYHTFPSVSHSNFHPQAISKCIANSFFNKGAQSRWTSCSKICFIRCLKEDFFFFF